MARSCFLVSMMKLFLLRVFLLSFIHTISSPSLAITNNTTDQSALLALKAHITHDPQNLLTTNWSTSTSVCNWIGVTCGLRHQRITVLNVSYFGLTGIIPSHLGNLSFLTKLDFRNNSFHGSLPIELTHLRRLKFINFGYNDFTGEIPSWFGSFSKLQSLKLYGNQFIGSIPTSIFNLSSSLAKIFLNENWLSGIIPKEIGKAKMLKELRLQENNLTGELPPEIGNIQLEILVIHFNALTKTIPPFILNMPYLKILALSNNYFSRGMLPDNICYILPNIEELYLNKCNLGERIPSQLSQCKKLRVFQLSENKLTGTIPKEIGNATMLKILHLFGNHLTGEIPQEFGNIELEILQIHSNTLTGTIPSFIVNTSHLKILALSNNYFYGMFPDNMCHTLPNLEELYLANCNLNGSILSQLSQCRKLRIFQLGQNNLTGWIPSQLSLCGKLQVISLESNYLDGSIPQTIGNLTNLEELYLADNSLEETIPKEIGNATMLKILHLFGNHLSGEIPQEIGNIELQALHISVNALAETIPSFIFNMSYLKILALSYNSFSGMLPYNVCHTLPNLEELYLEDCNLRGGIPSQLSQCEKLRVFQLSKNKLTGSIPSIIFNMSNLEMLGLSENNFEPTILPENICRNLPNLKILAMDGINLGGHIPSQLSQCEKLRVISLAFNDFVGSIPQTVGNLTNLEELYLGNNSLRGTIPDEIANLYNLKIFVLSNNLLRGPIPSTLFNTSNSSQLVYLDMSGNSFYGSLTRAFGTLRILQKLHLASNNFTSDDSLIKGFFTSLASCKDLTDLYLENNPLHIKLPSSIGNLSNTLKYLDVSTCKIRGTIPEEIGNLSSLLALWLDGNELIGSIPSTIRNLHKLQRLFLEDNKLQGFIPSEICQLKNLETLSLASNNFSGPLPSCFDDLTLLRKLYLNSNELNSSIPTELWTLTFILELNLSSNYLSGSLSEDVGKLKVMTLFDISKNQLLGAIPSSIESLQDLVFLSLAHNSFEGPIPQTLGELTSLVTMDLSKNNLSGMIPKLLEKLSHLKYLNLSFNKLYGEIPSGGPFPNFYAESFMCNEALYGPPRLQVSLCKTRRGQQGRIVGHVLKYVLPIIASTIFMLTLIFIWKRCKKSSVKQAIEANFLPSVEWRRISYHELVRVTNGFSETNLHGIGSFGSIYQGKLDDGMDVAVKVFNLTIEGGFKSFETECKIMSNLRHRNLIKVISVCSNIDFKAMVLQYMPCGSLEKWLHSNNHSLTMLQRLNIMIDVASAIEYLHHGYSESIIHCDIKPSNVLLSMDMVARVADFGIAKLVSGSDSITQTMTLATIGYMAPEYGLEGVVSTRGDIYSYGILLMETFTAKKPIDAMFVGELSLKKWVEDAITHYDVIDVADTSFLEGQNLVLVKEFLLSIFKLALCCTAESPIERKNMKEISTQLSKVKLKFLEGI